ncbi:HAMP domain-containing protein, partial [Stomatobaculum longum]|uniref:HAMP domain-containing protein n=1 Tax=Stomatobaculum longum TaxID=796942 RepID=UPI002F42AEB9
MKQSIRLRFTALIFLVLTLLMAGLLLANSFGLERFYRNQKVRDLERAYRDLDLLAAEKGAESAEMEELLRTYSSRYNIMVAIVDTANSKLLQSSENGKSRLYQRVQRYLFQQEDDSKTRVLKRSENYTIVQAYDASSQSANIDCFAYLSDNQTLLLMTTPVANLKESVRLANRFFFYVGALTLLFGVFLVWGMTSRITGPIRSLAALSEKLGHMDFSERYRGQNEDEIGVLGKNMNS